MRNYKKEIPSDCVAGKVEKDARPVERTLERLNIFSGHHENPKQALRMRRYTMAAGTSLLVIGLLWRFKPQSLDLRLELLQWLALAITLPWFATMGGFISGLRQRATLVLAESETIDDAAPKIIQTICETLGWDCGACWHWDKQDQLQRCTETWSVALSDVQEFVALSSQRRHRPGTGELIDRVLTTREPIRIADVLVEPGFLRASIAAKAGLRGAFAFPILIGVELYGVMEFYIRDVRQSDHALLAVMRSIGLQIGQFIARRAAEEQIHHLAHFDSLTGLANRNLFDQLLGHALTKAQRTATPLALLFIDLDGFKQVNDHLGHDAGDRLLATFSQRLRECLRKSDVGARLSTIGTPVRLGGDEFVVLIDDFTESSQLEVVAQRILATTGIPFLLGNKEVRVTASIGISVYPDDGLDIDSLTGNADSAMYCAKQAGKNAYRFYSAVVNQAI